MKWIFGLMLLLNAGFAFWQVNHAAPAPTSARVAAALPAYVNRLLLIEELEEERLRERTVVASVADDIQVIDAQTSAGPVEDASADAATKSCFSVGPLAAGEQVRSVGDWLSAAGGSAELREAQRREVSKFWVFFRPFPTRTEALAKVAKMVADDIEDIYVIPRGDMANAISLGLYSQESSLERRLAELESKGYKAETSARYESKKASWYDVEFPPDVEYPTAEFSEVFPGVEASAMRCG